MIKWETRVLLIHYLEHGLSKAAIAREAGIDRRTVTVGSLPESSRSILKRGSFRGPIVEHCSCVSSIPTVTSFALAWRRIPSFRRSDSSRR